LLGLLLLAVLSIFSGCQTVSFYAQAAKGQYQIIAHQKPIQKLLDDTNTPAELKARFVLLENLRSFAKTNLALPVDDHYRKYVDVHRPFVVWNVEAAPEFSMEPKSWWYPLVGSLEYRGYFSKRGATNYAAVLRRKGYDVTVGGVEAYSTLGWFKDPVLNTFLFEPDADLAEIIFHELGHQRVFVSGDKDFNEAFATTVGQEGARRWLKASGNTNAYEKYVAEIRHTSEYAALVKQYRHRLEALYGDEETEEGKVKATKQKRGVPAEQLRREKAQILADLKRDFSVMRTRWGNDKQYDDWFAQRLNNASLNSVAAYYDLVPAFEKLLQQNGGDLEKFYNEVERLSKTSKKQRHESLQALMEAEPKA
jgi:predicted aminopeptidase